MKKSIKIALSGITVSLFLAGCGSLEPAKTQQVNTQENGVTTAPNPNPTPDLSSGKQQHPPAVPKDSTKDTTGTYVGQIDSNSVEINLDGGPKAFVLNEESQKMIRSLKTGSNVSVVYTENEQGQLVLDKIELIK